MRDSFLVQNGYISAEILEILEQTWVSVPNWKWIALVLLFTVAFCLRYLIRVGLGKIRRALRGRQESNSFFHFLFNLELEIPLAWIVVSLLLLTGIDSLALSPTLDKYLKILVQLVLAFHIIVLAYKSVEALRQLFNHISIGTGTGLESQLVPFAIRALQILVVILGVLMTLQNFGVNVVSVLAGLGLGGLALALAAQDTAANVFGSITILFDRPFKIGDFIKVGNTEGTVESIGFRSTRIRTFYNSLVSIPNSVVAKDLIDNMQSRTRRRTVQTLGLLYETPPEKIQAFTDRIQSFLTSHPKVDREAVQVGFVNFNSASLDITVTFHLPKIETRVEELQATQEILLGFLKIAEEVGVEYAYPTQTLYINKVNSKEESATSNQAADRQI